MQCRKLFLSSVVISKQCITSVWYARGLFLVTSNPSLGRLICFFFPFGHTHAVFSLVAQPGHTVNSKTLTTSEAGQVGSYLKVQVKRGSTEP